MRSLRTGSSVSWWSHRALQMYFVGLWLSACFAFQTSMLRSTGHTVLQASNSRGSHERINGAACQKKNGCVNPRNLTMANGVTGANDSDVMDWSDLMRIGWDSQLVNTSSFTSHNDLQQEDLAKIEEYWDHIMPTVSYLGTVQVARIYKALCVAYRAHHGQKRKSGEPFIIHVRISADGSLCVCFVCNRSHW